LQKQEQEEDEKQLLVHARRLQQPLRQSNQYLPREELRVRHQDSSLRLQLIKARFNLSVCVVGFCVAGCLGVWYWISVAFRVGSMSSYASAFGGGFPPGTFAVVADVVIFAVVCFELLAWINPDIARHMRVEHLREREDYQREQQELGNAN